MFLQTTLRQGNQQFKLNLNNEDFTFDLVFRRTARGGSWFMDIKRESDGESLKGIPIVLGVNLIGQFKYKGFGSLYAERLDGSNDRVGFEDIAQVALYWSDE